MRVSSWSATTVGMILAGAIGIMGCESEDPRFEGAPQAQASGPRVQAPASPPTASRGASPEHGAEPERPPARAPAKRADGTPIPRRGQLPSDHPPVGAGVAPGPAPSDRAPRPRKPVTGDRITTYGQAGPLRWEAPESWEGVRPSSSMRMAEYLVPGPEGSEAAVLSVFHFGPGGGGGVEANLDRWIGQFKQPDGAPSEEAARRKKITVRGMTVHLLDVSGTYNAGAAMAGGGSKADQRVLGAIVEAPAGLFFFKLLGPKATVAAHEDSFAEFVASMRPGS